jgi:hypothetical protein
MADDVNVGTALKTVSDAFYLPVLTQIALVIGLCVVSSATGYAAHAQLQPPPPAVPMGISTDGFNATDRAKLEAVLAYTKALYQTMHPEVNKGDNLRAPVPQIIY